MTVDGAIIGIRTISCTFSRDSETLANAFPLGSTSGLFKSNREQPSLDTHRDTVLTDKRPLHCGRLVRYRVVILATLGTGLESILEYVLTSGKTGCGSYIDLLQVGFSLVAEVEGETSPATRRFSLGTNHSIWWSEYSYGWQAPQTSYFHLVKRQVGRVLIRHFETYRSRCTTSTTDNSGINVSTPTTRHRQFPRASNL